MKESKRFPWFETVAFLVILLLAVGSNLATHEQVAANESVTHSPQ